MSDNQNEYTPKPTTKNSSSIPKLNALLSCFLLSFNIKLLIIF